MELAVVIIVVITSTWILQGMVRRYGGEQAQPLGFWTALGLLCLARLALRGVALVIPKLDLEWSILVNFTVYVLVMAGLLMAYARVRAGRALAISSVLSMFLFVRGLLVIMGLM